MPTVYTEVEVDVELDEFDTEDLIEELQRRGRGVEVGAAPTELVDRIYQLRRTGRNFEHELDQLIYLVSGRIA